MTAKYLTDLRHQGAVAEIAKVKFPFPGPDGPDYDTIVNVPKPKMAVGEGDEGACRLVLIGGAERLTTRDPSTAAVGAFRFRPLDRPASCSGPP